MNSDASNQQVHSDDRYPVSILMERREKTRGRWSFTEWKVTGILPATEFSGKSPAKTLVHKDDESQQYLWRNFVIELIKDGAESYWNNLMASTPALFVVCRDDEDSGELTPFLITANYDEIIGYQEVDDQVFALSIPPEIYRWLERFIVNHYIPPQRRKRQRIQWADGNEQTPPPARRH